MKKIIDGKRYDTETASLIGDWEFSELNDSHHVYEALYRTPNGAYFLWYQGGPASRYRVPGGSNTTSGSSGIHLMDAGEALAWCESHDVDAETIEAHFTVAEG